MLHVAPFAGALHYRDHDPQSATPQAQVWVEVLGGTPPIRWSALVDTGAPWCIVGRSLAKRLGLGVSPDSALSTRIGIVRGQLHRLDLVLAPDVGEGLAVAATVFASADWSGPSILGYQGFLERIRFAVDPGLRWFHFGPVTEQE